MNWFWLVAAVVCMLAFLVHAIVGHSELCQLLIGKSDDRQENQIKIQAFAGWHWVSVDLFLASVTLFVLALTSWLSATREISLLLGLYFAATGVVWLGTVLRYKSENRQIYQVGQWMFSTIVCCLVLIGRQHA